MKQFWPVWKSERKKWILNVKGDDGKRRQMTVPVELARDGSAAGRRAVETWAAKEFSEKSKASEWAEPTMTELAAKFLAHAEQDERIEAATLAQHRTTLNIWVLPFVVDKTTFGMMTPPELTVTRLVDFVCYVRKRRAPTTCRNILNSLSTCFTVARARGWTRITTNPAQDDAVRLELPELEHREVEVLSRDVVETLLWSADVPLVWRLRYALGALAGLEDGVASGLKLDDIERYNDGLTLLIRRAVKIVGRDGWATAGNTKNQFRGSEKVPRRIPAHPVLATLIDEWLADGWELWTGKGHGPSADDWLLPRPDGKAWRPRSAELLREHIAMLRLTASDGAQEFKQLRAWFATELEATGASDSTRKRLMGHRGSSVAARHYTAEQRELDRCAVNAIRIGEHGNESRRSGDGLPNGGTAIIVHCHSETSARQRTKNVEGQVCCAGDIVDSHVAIRSIAPVCSIAGTAVPRSASSCSVRDGNV